MLRCASLVLFLVLLGCTDIPQVVTENADAGAVDTAMFDTAVSDTAEDDLGQADAIGADAAGFDAADAAVAADVVLADTWAGVDQAIPDAHVDDAYVGQDAHVGSDAHVEPDANGGIDAGLGFDPEHRVGILYFVHHVAPATAAHASSSSLTVEQVIRGQGPFGDIYGGSPYHGRALGHLYHHQPDLGFYCLFDTITDATLPADAVNHANTWNCNSNPGAVALAHAQQLVEAGVDYVVLDLSNAPTVETTIAGAGPLLTALRPTQILFREWANLRQQGIETPQIAAWAPIPVGGTLWQRYLDLYNQYPGLALSHQATGEHSGKMVFFYVDSYDTRAPDPAILNAIASNGGSNNVVPVPMWTHLNSNGTFGSTYRWAFMSPCIRGGQRTTTILGSGVECNQKDTPSSVIGSQLTVGPSYQYEGGYASLPFQAPGKLRGLTLKKQFQKAFQAQRDYLLITGWNETTSGHWQSAYTFPDVYAVGLEGDDTYGYKQFVDAYGTEYSRDLEPSLEGGRTDYDLMRSCIARYKSGSCVVVGGQDCCDLTEPYVNVFSLAESPHSGYARRAIVSIDPSEVQTLLAGRWRQVCHRYPGTVEFCVSSSEEKYQSGPFIAFAEAAAGRVGVYRCLFTVSNKTFLTTSPGVECAASDITGGDTPLFYASTIKNSETPRVLRRCYDTTFGSHFHAVGLNCPAGTEDAPAFGYVR